MSIPRRRPIRALTLTALVLLTPATASAAVAADTIIVSHEGSPEGTGSQTSPPPVTGSLTSRPAPSGSYRWPVPGPPHPGRLFDPPSTTYGRGHRGVDLVAPAGGPVLAAGDGTVVFAGSLAGRGVVSIQHPDGLRTTYEPVTATVTVGVGVRAGQQIGILEAGHPGCSASACLHWGVRRGADIYLDPLRLIGRWEVRLLVWSG